MRIRCERFFKKKKTFELKQFLLKLAALIEIRTASLIRESFLAAIMAKPYGQQTSNPKKRSECFMCESCSNHNSNRTRAQIKFEFCLSISFMNSSGHAQKEKQSDRGAEPDSPT